MKIVKTILGWELQPETEDERYHLSWFIDWIRSSPSFIPAVEDGNVPVGLVVTKEMLLRAAQAITCPCCHNYNCYSGSICSWCGYQASSKTVDTAQTFMTKGPVE